MKETWEDDRDPLAALRGGDPALFEAFVRAEIATFLGFFARLGASPSGAEDLVQDLYLKLFQHSHTYRPQGRFAAYAFRTARNLWIDRLRRRASRPGPAGGGGGQAEAQGPLERVADGTQEEPGTALARREEAGRVAAALASLPEHHRLVFELGVVQGLPYQEIGEILTIPVGTVKSRMFHAVRRLQALLGDRRGDRTGGGEVA